MFSELSESAVQEQIVPPMQESVTRALQTVSLKDISTTFVPDAHDRELIVAISKSLTAKVQFMPADKALTKEFRAGKVAVLADSLADRTELRQANQNDSPELKHLQALGNLTFRVVVKEDGPATAESIRPNHMQQIIFRITGLLVKEFAEKCIFDSAYPPYVVSVSTRYTPSEPYIQWTDKTTMLYKREVGQWAEIYTGQFDDYRDHTFEERVKFDLSNRMSEIHLLNKNSALLYMDEDNYDRFFIRDERTPSSTGYIYNVVMHTIMRVRTIQFFMQILNRAIDFDQENLSSDDYLNKAPTAIKDDLDRTNRLKHSLQNMLGPIMVDLTRSHRQHYAAVLLRMVQLANLSVCSKHIHRRIDSNTRELNAIFLDKQEESSQRQESILNTVNMVLGASIIFEIVSNVTMDDEVAQPINRFLSILLVLVFFINIFRIRLRSR